MDAGTILGWLDKAWPVVHPVLVVLGSLVVIATLVVQITPSTEDDALWNKVKAVPVLGSLIVALEAFSVIGRKS